MLGQFQAKTQLVDATCTFAQAAALEAELFGGAEDFLDNLGNEEDLVDDTEALQQVKRPLLRRLQ